MGLRDLFHMNKEFKNMKKHEKIREQYISLARNTINIHYDNLMLFVLELYSLKLTMDNGDETIDGVRKHISELKAEAENEIDALRSFIEDQYRFVFTDVSLEDAKFISDAHVKIIRYGYSMIRTMYTELEIARGYIEDKESVTVTFYTNVEDGNYIEPFDQDEENEYDE